MKKFWTKTTRTTLLLLIILFLSAALFIQANSSTTVSNPLFASRSAAWERPASMSVQTEDISETITGYDATTSLGDVGSPVQATPAPTPQDQYRSAQQQDLENANGLVSSLRRIIRSGNSMNALRSSNNPTLQRRCFEGMKKLQSEARDIRQRRRNITLSSSTTSLGKVFSNIMKCVSCDSDAPNYCALATKDLIEINRSLSIN